VREFCFFFVVVVVIKIVNVCQTKRNENDERFISPAVFFFFPFVAFLGGQF
jgi:hypothetical protein